jgi:hypothetical protein
LFDEGLAHLNVAQLMGYTVVLLDEAADYLGRAWCILESVFADSATPSPLQILKGSTAVWADRENVESRFRELLRDRPHLIWRAILDTEVFRIQSPSKCMERLGLETTRPHDLSLVYQALRKLGAPKAVHIDQSELVTGCFPLPVTADGNSVVLSRVGWREVVRTLGTAEATTLDWSDCLDLDKAWLERDVNELSPPHLYWRLPERLGKAIGCARHATSRSLLVVRGRQPSYWNGCCGDATTWLRLLDDP